MLEPSARALLLSANRDRFAPRDRPVPAAEPWPASDEPSHRDAIPVRPANSATQSSNYVGATASAPSVGAVMAGTRKGRPLTSREREILGLVASGTSNKGIARALSVSANTVKFHLAAVFDKLNAATRAEAVAEAIRRGELSL